MERFKSRKFILAIVAALVVLANRAFDLKLKEDDVVMIVGALLSFVLVEGARDSIEAAKKK